MDVVTSVVFYVICLPIFIFIAFLMIKGKFWKYEGGDHPAIRAKRMGRWGK